MLSFISIAFLLGLVCMVTGNKSPCHQYRARLDYACEKILLPKGFCPSCGIGPYTSTGHYEDCTRTTVLESSPQCFDKFQEYVKLNPCDLKRKQALSNYQSKDPLLKEQGRQVLDYFHYSMCEVACDCIPQAGANPNNRQMDAYRGNCQGHLWYDTCKVFPNLKVLQLNGTARIDETSMLPICPFVDEWYATPDGQNFENISHTSVNPAVVNFLQIAWVAQQVPESSYWLDCYKHEVTQGRIEAYTQVKTNSSSFQTLRINAGNYPVDYTDVQNKVWLTDRYFKGGNTLNQFIDIRNTKSDILYESERNSQQGPLQYEIPVPNGRYKVLLGFSEIVFTSAGMRVFDVTLEGNLVYNNLDLVATAGGPRIPVVLRHTQIVKDGFLSVSLDPVKDKPKISWILVKTA